MVVGFDFCCLSFSSMKNTRWGNYHGFKLFFFLHSSRPKLVFQISIFYRDYCSHRTTSKHAV
jgi:hypothetical protein